MSASTVEVTAMQAVAELGTARGIQFDARLLDAFIQMVRASAFREIIGHSDPGIPIVDCMNCGPVITVSREAGDGDIVYCRVCGSAHRLHRDKDRFMVEPTGNMGSAEDLKPRPEKRSIEAFIAKAPGWVKL